MSSAREDGECCGMCARFTRRSAEETARGHGWCVGYERYVHANSPPTVLFKAASADQHSDRRAFLEKHQEAA